MPEEKTMPDYTGWKLANGYLCCPRCLARIVIKEREPYITMILRVADEHVCYAEAKVMYAAKSAAWRLPRFVLERRGWRSWQGEGRETVVGLDARRSQTRLTDLLDANEWQEGQ